jgi:hypothetical protein
MARPAHPRAALGRPSKVIEGVVPGGTEHQLLLALRGCGGMTSDQVRARFGVYQSAALSRLKKAGMVEVPTIGQKGFPIRLTERGRSLTNPDGPLARTKTLITYCQL